MIYIYQAEQTQMLETCISHLLLYLNKIKVNKIYFCKMICIWGEAFVFPACLKILVHLCNNWLHCRMHIA